jgi:hypothetical protein
MMDVDIAGIAEDSKPLFAQVTFNESGDVGDKRARLRAVASKEAGHAILFCRCGQISQRNHVTEVPLQMVFDAFASDKNLKQFLT